MQILARHLTADLFNCKNNKLTDIDLIKSTLQELLAELRLKMINFTAEKINADQFVLVAVLNQGHITMHVYPELKYVAMDIFLCQENAEPDKLAQGMRTFFKPDKTKTTVLKRGNFGSAKDLKPKVKTKVAPLRRIHNTGAKVIRILAHRNRY